MSSQKKNFSIASLIFFISKHFYKSYKFEYSILTSKVERNLFDDKNINKIDLTNWISIFFKIRNLSKNVFNHDVIHIHGVWAPIQILSILLCNLKNKSYVIHPHGMLLEEALRSTGYFKFIYKNIFIFFRFLISDKTFFVSITDQEKNAIKKFFQILKYQIFTILYLLKKRSVNLKIKKNNLFILEEFIHIKI